MNGPGQMLPAAVLAGGLATRLGPLTRRRPKALLDVNGQPFIAHELRLLRRNGVERVVVCAGYLGDMIRQRVGDGSEFGLRVDYSFDGPRLLGTAGALRNALPLLGEAFFVLYGDSYLACDYAAVQSAFVRAGRAGLMTVFRNDDAWDASNVEFADGAILAYDKQHRTPRMRHIDYGLGVLDRRAFAYAPAAGPCDLASLYQELLRHDELAAYEVETRFFEIGSRAGLDELRQHLRHDRVGGAAGD